MLTQLLSLINEERREALEIALSTDDPEVRAQALSFYDQAGWIRFGLCALNVLFGVWALCEKYN